MEVFQSEDIFSSTTILIKMLCFVLITMSRPLSDISLSFFAPLDQGPLEVQSQMVPSFSRAFFLSTYL